MVGLDFHTAELVAAGLLFSMGYERLSKTPNDGLGISFTLAGMTAFFDATQALWPPGWR